MSDKCWLPVPQRDRNGNIFVIDQDNTRHDLEPLRAKLYMMDWCNVVGGAYVCEKTKISPDQG